MSEIKCFIFTPTDGHEYLVGKKLIPIYAKYVPTNTGKVLGDLDIYYFNDGEWELVDTSHFYPIWDHNYNTLYNIEEIDEDYLNLLLSYDITDEDDNSN